MKKVTKKLRVQRMISFVLACVMVLTMLSPASVEAAEESIVLKNTEGEETTTFVSGEPIYVDATGNAENDAWVGLYDKGVDKGEYYGYYYLKEGINPRNIYHSTAWYDEGKRGIFLEGEFDIILFKDGSYDYNENSKITVTITKPSEWEPDLEVQSATVEAGKPIIAKATSFADYAWVGIYAGHKTTDDTFGKDYKSFNYVNGINTVDCAYGPYAAGDYTVVLFGDSTYDQPQICIPVTVEAKESSREKTEPTCEADGKIVVSYTDGTTKEITAAEDPTLAKLDHDYDANDDGQDDWNYNGEEKKTHTKTCVRCTAEKGCSDCKNVTVTDECSWNDGEVTKEPTATENGEKTFTCNICGGKYIESISAKVAVGDKVIKEPTCEEEGTLRTYYDEIGGNDYIDTPIPKKGHAYPDDWTYDESTKKHSKVCENDENHVQIENCTFSKDMNDGKFTYTCEVCEGSYEESVISTEKKKFDIGEEIIVTVDYDVAAADWVGLYKKGEIPGNSPDSPMSFYYYYPSVSGKTFDIFKTPSNQINNRPDFDPGEYTLYLCANDGYEVIASVDITIGHTFGEWKFDETAKTHTRVCDGVKKHSETDDCVFEEKLLDGGVEYTCTVCGGSYVDSHDFEYTFNEADKTHTKSCTTHKDCSENKTEPCTFNKGVVSTEKDNTIVYTCKDCKGSYEKDIIELDKTVYDLGEAINITVNYPSETKDWIGLFKKNAVLGTDESFYYYYPKNVGAGESLNIYDATYQHSITQTGEYRLYFLKNDGYEVIASVDITIDHTYGDWVFNAEEKTHTRVCKGHPDQKETAYCDFETETVDGNVKYTCKVCKGSYVDSHEFGYVFNAEEKTHTKTCTKHENCSANGSENCKFTKEIKEGKLVYTCNDCKGSYEEAILSTDKKTYDLGESINVTVDYDFGPSDWVGIYKKGEVPTPPGPGAPMSFYYYYPSVSGKTFNIFDGTGQTGGVRGDIDFGEYTLYLCANDGYDVIGSIDVTIGHEFGEWKYDENTKTHSRTCDGSTKHQEGPVVCTFEDKVTKEPTATETGIKTFTCSVCGGSYEEVLPTTSATIVKTETVDPTCEEDGKIIFTYSDGTVKEEVIEKLGHDYDEENYTFNEADKTHSSVCKNDSSHVKTVACNFNRIAKDGDKATYKCTVCGGTFEAGALVVAKDTYAVGEDINVIASCDTNESWVGLYKADDEYGSIVSYYWYYVVSNGDGINRDGKTINLTDKAFYNTQRLDSMTPGEYKIILFGDGGYDKIIAEKTITITEASTTFDMKINGKEVSDGEVLQFKDDDVVNINVTANGNPGTSWVGIYTAHYTKDTDFQGIGSADFFWIGDNNGKTVNLKSDFREPGDYCIVIFGDHGYDYVKQIVYYTFTRDGAEKILIEPTCTKPGIKYVTYLDGSDAYVPINKLGHDIKDWTFDADSKTHSSVCERTVGDVACGQTVTENCNFEAVEDKDGVMIYTCTVCNGQYSEEQEEVLPPYEEKEDRIYGETRYETATKIADQLKKDQNIEKFNNIIIASGKGYADALSGTYLAKVKNAPILLVDTANAKTMKSIADYVNANIAEDGTVYILGGKNAISDAFTSDLKVDKNHIKRLGGATRYETNIMILEEAGVAGKEILVCTGDNFADSLSASALGRPVLLVNNKNLLDAQKSFLKEMKNKKFFIIGGKNAISYDMEDLIRDYGGTERISGATRYETSTKLAERFIEAPKAVILAYGHDFPDGLAGGMLALNMDAPLILVHDSYKDSAVSYAKDNNISSGKVLGGPVRISESVAKEILAR